MRNPGIVFEIGDVAREQGGIMGKADSGDLQILGAGLLARGGDEGLPGQPGMDGAVGPPFAQLIIDAVNTLNPGESATVGQSVVGNEAHLTFGIPRGDTGGPGNDGGQGIQGIPGNDGAPGEVTNAALATAISATSNNTNAVATLDTAFANDPPTLADMETMRAKMNEMILAARRA